MKTNTFLSIVVTVFALATSALAVDGGSSARQGSLFNGESGPRLDAVYDGGPRLFSLGAYSQYQKRGMTDDSDFVTDWSIRHLMMYAGFDLLPWLTIQGGIGQSDLSIADDEARDADMEWMGGAQVRLLDYMLLEPIVGDDTYWLGVDSQFRYTSSKSEGFGGDITWGEMFGSLTMSLTSRPERSGFMDRISLYFGPAVSMIRGKDGNTDVSEDQSLGFIGGLHFMPSDNLTLTLEFQQFGDMTVGGGVGLHF